VCPSWLNGNYAIIYGNALETVANGCVVRRKLVKRSHTTAVSARASSTTTMPAGTTMSAEIAYEGII